jgi:hypothetical protein
MHDTTYVLLVICIAAESWRYSKKKSRDFQRNFSVIAIGAGEAVFGGKAASGRGNAGVTGGGYGLDAERLKGEGFRAKKAAGGGANIDESDKRSQRGKPQPGKMEGSQGRKDFLTGKWMTGRWGKAERLKGEGFRAMKAARRGRKHR